MSDDVMEGNIVYNSYSSCRWMWVQGSRRAVLLLRALHAAFIYSDRTNVAFSPIPLHLLHSYPSLHLLLTER